MNNLKKVLLSSVLCFGVYASASMSIEAIAINKQGMTAIEHMNSSDFSTYNSSIQSSNPDLTPKKTDLMIVPVPDKALKEALLSKLGKPANSELTNQDMESITSLTLSNEFSTQISSLSGLEYATNLSSLFLNTNNVTDFSPLEQLSSLTYINIDGNYLTSANFPDLSKSTGITHISVNSRRLSDDILPMFAHLMNLERLYLDSNINITTLEPLKELPKLRSISVQFCGIVDFTVINDFPALNDLAAFGQNIGRTNMPATISRTALTYDRAQQTVFIPFSVMPNRLTNFDGYVPPFTTSTSANETKLGFNGSQLPEEQLQITDQGVTVLAITEEEFDALTSFTYNTRMNNPAGSYVQPENYGFYSISAGTYLQQFNVTDEPQDGAPVTVSYLDDAGNPISEPTVLNGKIDAAFSVLPKELDNWIVKSTPENTEGTFTQNPQEFIFIYEKKLGAPVTVRYLDETLHDIDEPTVLNGKIDAPFNAVPKEISSWVLKTTSENSSGSFTPNTQEIRFIYEKALGAPVTVQYLDTDNNKLAETEVLSGKLDTPFESTNKQIPSWQLDEMPENNKGFFTSHPQTIRYIYKKNERPLIPLAGEASRLRLVSPIEYLNLGTTSSNRRLTQPLTTQSENSKKTNEQSLIPSLLPKTFSFSEKKAVSEELPKKKQGNGRGTGSVTIKFVDEQGNELAAPNTITGKIGESYTVTAKKLK
ncbi:hypothetical protein IGL98_003310 [Enterococcus sp. DIV0840]|uniref:MucBP domain-containing protein n=1 Tax=unclassified Enterococcus TaxID=2608891 RepID=UPI001A8DE7B3|nr:MucBP domain-containing protein [Enterococcus sp. DIV0849a]MBO0435483.1 MucBP domain-containing protein [Enterococcus sp. DIV0849a]